MVDSVVRRVFIHALFSAILVPVPLVPLQSISDVTVEESLNLLDVPPSLPIRYSFSFRLSRVSPSQCDNWCGYDHAQEILKEWSEEE